MSQQSDKLREIGENMGKNGFPISSAVIISSARRMDRMEELIVEMRDNIETVAEVKLQDLIVGECYEVQSRNIRHGVWDGKEFHGIRHKFGDYFMDSEIHYDLDDHHGTAKAIRILT